MNLTQKLISLLDNYIEEFQQLKNEHKQLVTNQSLYDELILALKENKSEEHKLFIPILLNCIYGDNIYVDEYYRILLQSNKDELLEQFTIKIKKDYNDLKERKENLKNRIDRNYWMFKSAKRVRICLKYQTRISNSKNDIYHIQRILAYYESAGVISNKEEILLINEIELHNRKVAAQKRNIKYQEYTENLYNEIPNILNFGFEQYDKIEVPENRKKTLDNFKKEIINIINDIETDDIVELLKSYKKYNLNISEYGYIILEVLDTYLEELLALYELLIDKDVYSYKEGRTDVIKDYYLTLEKYIIIRNYYNHLEESYEKEETPVEEPEIFIQEQKRLIFARSDINITKSRIISDMHNIPYEYYDIVYDLLTRFKNGELTKNEIKGFNNHKQKNGHIELRYDAIRIMLKHIKDDIYVVLGAFVKKRNNDNTMYVNMVSRKSPDVSTEENLKLQLEFAKKTEKELETLVSGKGRKRH